jgi:hypothetical protein
MKALKIIGWVAFGLVAAAALGLALGLPVMWLWNWLMPALFGLPAITFWQAVGLLVLSHLLFKSHGPGHGHREKKGHFDHFARRVRCAVDERGAEPAPPGAA